MDRLPSLIGGLIALTAVGAVMLDHEVVDRCSRMLDRSIYYGARNRRSVALTFDDGPCRSTPEVLAFLQAHGVRATFFQSGMQVERYPAIARQVFYAGHEIGNHAYSHADLRPRFGRDWHLPTPRLMYRELARTQRVLTTVCDGTAPRLFRAPYGRRWVGLDAIRKRLGLLGVQWTVIGHDWEWPAERIAPYVLDRIVPGAIICLHDGGGERDDADLTELMRALKIIVPALRNQGYAFETVSELLLPEPVAQPLTVA